MTGPFRRLRSRRAGSSRVLGPRPKGHFDEVLSEDTYLVSFPRSGNTWLRCMVTAVVHGGQVTPELVAATVPDVHRSDPAVRVRTGPMWVKSHFAAPDRPFPGRVIYLVRHGLDAMASYHRYLQLRGRLGTDVAFDAFVTSTDIWPCPWPEHVGGWFDALEAVPADRAMTLRYEDLVASPHEHLGAICRFLGLDADAAAIELAVRSGSRDNMAQLEALAGSGSLNHVAHRPSADPRGAPGTQSFLVACGPVLTRAGYRQA